jgi:ABC-type nitrate/sulfonate/bicarbonate transport system substrate-binding protein
MRLGLGGKILAVLFGLAIIGYAVDRHFGTDRVTAALGIPFVRPGLVRPGDFPAGASAPAGDVVALPSRPLRIVAVPRGADAPLLLALGGLRTNRESFLFKGYGLDAEFTVAADQGAARDALALGGDHGGADIAVFSVDALAELRPQLRDAAPRAVALLGHSRGFDGIAATSGIDRSDDLGGKSIAVVRYEPSRYFALWRLAQSGLDEHSVRFVEVPTTTDAAAALRDGRVAAAAGITAQLALAAKERGGKILATTADAPHLCAIVLVARGDFASRYAEAVRRLVRAFFDEVDAVGKDPTAAAELLGTASPSLGDPRIAISADPPARLSENLAFFGASGDSPVRYAELYQSASSVWAKLKEPSDKFPPAESFDLTVLKAVARATDDRKP